MTSPGNRTCRVLRILALFGCGAATLDSVAADATVELDPFEVIAHPTGADERTASIWVVTPDADAPSAMRTADLMTQVPGVHIDRAGAAGGRSSIYLRGTEENHTLVLLDGVPLNDPTDSRGGGVDASTIDPSLVRNIAVVRGPASVRHGPEVLGGIAHIETTATTSERLRAGAELGGDDFARAFVSGSLTPRENTTLNLGAAGLNDGSLADGGRTRLRFARASLAIRAAADVKIGLWHGTSEAYSFPDDSGGERLAVIRTLEHRDEARTGLSIRATGNGLGGTWTATADAAQFDSDINTPGVAPGVRDPAGLPPILTDTRLRRYRASLYTDRTLDRGSFAFGVDFQHEKGRDNGGIDFGGFVVPTSFSLSRTRGGVFGEGTHELGGGIVASAGVRWDRFDEGFSRGTTRVGFLGPIGNGSTQWRVNAGTAFKPPSFYGLAHPFVGNPDLVPESVRMLEAGVRQAFGDGRGLLDFTLFQMRTRNAVDFDPGPPPLVVNIDGLRSRGAEFAVRYKLTTDLSISGAAAYTDARSEPEGARMRSRPRWRGNFGAAWTPLPALTITGGIVAVSDVPDSSIATGDVLLGSWARFDLAAVLAIDSANAVTLAVDNLFDRAYEEVIGFPTQGRRLRVGWQTSF